MLGDEVNCTFAPRQVAHIADPDQNSWTTAAAAAGSRPSYATEASIEQFQRFRRVVYQHDTVHTCCLSSRSWWFAAVVHFRKHVRQIIAYFHPNRMNNRHWVTLSFG